MKCLMKSVLVFVLIKQQQDSKIIQDDQVLLCDPVGGAGLLFLVHDLLTLCQISPCSHG